MVPPAVTVAGLDAEFCQDRNMTFKASRHAKRRMKLYEIDESLVEKIVLNSELSP